MMMLALKELTISSLPALSDDVLDRLAVVADMSIADIRGQLDQADAERPTDAPLADPSWYACAQHALRRTRIVRAQIGREQKRRAKRARKLSQNAHVGRLSAKLFASMVRERFGTAVYVDLMSRARQEALARTGLKATEVPHA